MDNQTPHKEAIPSIFRAWKKLKSIKAKKDTLETQIKTFMGLAQILTHNGMTLVSWQEKVCEQFDTRRFEREHQDLYRSYYGRLFGKHAGPGRNRFGLSEGNRDKLSAGTGDPGESPWPRPPQCGHSTISP
jgi:hypothetical protein